MKKSIIEAGDKYGKLIAINFHHRGKKGEQYWLFRCDCGNEKMLIVQNVKNGNTKSCGCLDDENKLKHGMCGTRTYKSWQGMKTRCFNKNTPRYYNYGGRGITVCKEWLIFENFFDDMGVRPLKTSLDRIDNNGNYEPNNCRWADIFIQNNNTRNNIINKKGRQNII